MIQGDEQAYFNWLKKQIRIPTQRSSDQRLTYNELFTIMHDREFVWTVPNDDNRIEDGFELRAEFCGGADHSLHFGVSFLEVLVGLSRRVAWTAEGVARNWAWQLIVNIGLDKMCDPLTTNKRNRIIDTLDVLIWRQYDRNGKGGFFPLANPVEDQTKVEIWYQMHAFLNEQLYGE